MSVLTLLALGLLAYVIGSLPMHRAFGLSKIASETRQTQWLRGTSRFALNVTKGIVAVHIAAAWGPTAALIAGFAVAVGHNFPVWSNFRGGIGMGVMLGAMVALDTSLGALALIAWLTTIYVFQSSMIAALGTALIVPVLAHIFDVPVSPLGLLPITGVVLWRHRHIWVQAFESGPKQTEDVFKNL